MINLLNLFSGSYTYDCMLNHIFDLFVYRLSDATGKMVFSLMGEGSFSKSLLDPNDGKIFLPVLQKYVNFHILQFSSLIVGRKYLCGLEMELLQQRSIMQCPLLM